MRILRLSGIRYYPYYSFSLFTCTHFLIHSLTHPFTLFLFTFSFPFPFQPPAHTLILCVLLFLILCFCYLFSLFSSCISTPNSLICSIFCFVLYCFLLLCWVWDSHTHTHIYEIGMLTNFSVKDFFDYFYYVILFTHIFFVQHL